jgi:hypothetical protein
MDSFASMNNMSTFFTSGQSEEHDFSTPATDLPVNSEIDGTVTPKGCIIA